MHNLWKCSLSAAESSFLVKRGHRGAGEKRQQLLTLARSIVFPFYFVCVCVCGQKSRLPDLAVITTEAFTRNWPRNRFCLRQLNCVGGWCFVARRVVVLSRTWPSVTTWYRKPPCRSLESSGPSWWVGPSLVWRCCWVSDHACSAPHFPLHKLSANKTEKQDGLGETQGRFLFIFVGFLPA